VTSLVYGVIPHWNDFQTLTLLQVGLLLIWLVTEHRKCFAYQSWIAVPMTEVRERRVLMIDDIWRALLFLFFSIVSFFGTGNLVSCWILFCKFVSWCKVLIKTSYQSMYSYIKKFFTLRQVSTALIQRASGPSYPSLTHSWWEVSSFSKSLSLFLSSPASFALSDKSPRCLRGKHNYTILNEAQWKPLNVVTLWQTKSDTINRMITITSDFCYVMFCKCDVEMWLH